MNYLHVKMQRATKNIGFQRLAQENYLRSDDDDVGQATRDKLSHYSNLNSRQNYDYYAVTFKSIQILKGSVSSRTR